jgi:hypothetical protein
MIFKPIPVKVQRENAVSPLLLLLHPRTSSASPVNIVMAFSIQEFLKNVFAMPPFPNPRKRSFPLLCYAQACKIYD